MKRMNFLGETTMGASSLEIEDVSIEVPLCGGSRGDRLQNKKEIANKLEVVLKPVFGSFMRSVYFDYKNSEMYVVDVDERFWSDEGLFKKDLTILLKHTNGFSIEGSRVFLNI